MTFMNFSGCHFEGRTLMNTFIWQTMQKDRQRWITHTYIHKSFIKTMTERIDFTVSQS